MMMYTLFGFYHLTLVKHLMLSKKIVCEKLRYTNLNPFSKIQLLVEVLILYPLVAKSAGFENQLWRLIMASQSIAHSGSRNNC